MRHYVLIKREEITPSMVGCSGHANAMPVPVMDAGVPTTDYRIIPLTSDCRDGYAGYKKYTRDELDAVIDDLLAGKKIYTKLKYETQISAWADPEGARARYQSLGILSNDEPEVAWDAYVDYLINGVIYYVTGAEIGDTLDFEVWHPVDGKLDGFASGWLLWDGSHDSSGYPAKICAGLQIKVRLNKGEGNVGETKVLLNAKLHELP